MSVTPKELSAVYPRLYHMAEAGSWESISKHGLLSTSSLLTLFEIQGNDRRNIERQRRAESIRIEHKEFGSAVIRDQKPIIETKLKAALSDYTLEEWYVLLNEQVFFWLTTSRLQTLLAARAYRNKPHLILTLDTLPLVTTHEQEIWLSPMNSGNTLPFAHPRGRDTFRKMNEYPFQERLKRGPDYTVVELAVKGGVTDIRKYVLLAESMVSDGETLRTLDVIYST
jgi:hypothetical protein